MNIIFWFAIIFIFLCLPPIIVSIVLLMLSKKFNISYKTVGYLKYTNILFILDNNDFFVNVKIDLIQIYLIWFRCRILFRGWKINILLKDSKVLLSKKGKISKIDYLQTYVIKKNETDNTQMDILKMLKNKFYDIILKKYISKHLKDNKQISIDEEVIDNIIKPSEISQKDKIIRNLLVMFDILIEFVEVNFKLNEMEVFHNLSFRKFIIGAIKGINKVRLIYINI